MKNLVFVLIVLFTFPALAAADGMYPSDNAFSGASGITVDPKPVDKGTAVSEPEAEFKIDEKLYAESIGSDGYYGGGFYGEEKYDSLALLYTITSHRTDFRLRSGIFLPHHFISPFGTSFLFSRGVFRGGSVGFSVGGLSIIHR